MVIIETKDIIKEYGDGIVTKALCGISLRIEKGEFVAIMGPSGCGKSTLMHILGFLDRPTYGQYLFEGQNFARFSDDQLAEIRNEKIGFVFQSYNLLPRTSVFDNVMLPLFYKENKQKIGDTAKSAIAAVGLSHRANHMPSQLSGGEQQRVAIARALVNNPLLILADEPTGNLDSKGGEQIMQVLEELNEKGHTIVVVTHETETARFAKRIIKMKDGCVIGDEIVNHRRRAGDGKLK
ncbi:MAG: macrolide ABC transporter ATP-binding protein [Candidatus Portnoybacteria bacterium RBG_19FT_COMBO_36_7]|uniref:Macrolide ABC transporter ATP-binding protein n=1 Tax=Candidatus Portnoybacteria bacterium RBG_19FT_COMBO_36_7 TaxID=1801992 RepID=A0A1G2F7B8_9BACT|nr:MAG: macrolide ABC transporter ATP-binding protein [Candidatus Portnoybacteria bacterium RBG_19FT_COMBO_36_7]